VAAIIQIHQHSPDLTICTVTKWRSLSDLFKGPAASAAMGAACLGAVPSAEDKPLLFPAIESSAGFPTLHEFCMAASSPS
jgi:hypothetical protein